MPLFFFTQSLYIYTKFVDLQRKQKNNVMNATELILEKQSFTFSANIKKSNSHYKMLMMLGRCFPSTKAQAKHFIATQNFLDVLNSKDVEVVEPLMNKHGFKGDYKYTKSKKWVRLENIYDLKNALKAEFINK